jgi:hypothetical protein
MSNIPDASKIPMPQLAADRKERGIRNMDARELTKKYIDMSNELFQTKKQVECLTQEFEKLRLLVEDMKIDVQMMQRGNR